MNAPLAEVVFEIRFPGHFEVYGGLERFQNALGSEFPTLFVPKAAVGEPLALKPFQWRTEDGTRSVSIALNSFAYTSRSYGVFPGFRSEFAKIADRFFAVHRPLTLTRLGLRYVNVLPPMPGTSRALHPWLALGLTLPPFTDSATSELAASVLLTLPGGSLRIAFGDAAQMGRPTSDAPGAAGSGFVLDLDYFRHGPASVDEIDGFLSEAHGAIEAVFFGLVTPEAVRVMEGAG